MSQYSDSESSDSDSGIRYKTQNTRQKSNQSSSSCDRDRSRSKSPNEICIGPQIPQNTRDFMPIGPQLPPHLLNQEETNHCTSYGPQLPPNLTKTEENCVGPQLPPHLTKTEESCNTIGPQIPPHLRKQLEETSYEHEPQESDEETFGPLPQGSKIISRSQIALEERALQLKMNQLEPSQIAEPIREEWMLELPEVKAANLGLGPRQFRKKDGPDMSNRSAWTDAPNAKKKAEKVDLQKEAEDNEIRRRNEEQAKISKKLKRKNKESLLEIHQSKVKQKKDETSSERRPFSRETDLQVNRFDEAQKKAVLKKAQLLDDRFSSGKSKFL